MQQALNAIFNRYSVNTHCRPIQWNSFSLESEFCFRVTLLVIR